MQVKNYMRFMGYPVPKNRATKKETSDAEALEELVYRFPGDVVLPKILEGRKLLKAIGYLKDTYLGRDGRMHPVYTYAPDTGRLSSRAPNFQNIPQGYASEVERRLALAIRAAVIPTPGYVLVEFDWKAVEALLVAYFAQDPDYARISVIDPHSFFAARKLGRPADLGWDDARLIAYLEEVKHAHNDVRQVCKVFNHSFGYGIGVDHLSKVLGLSRRETKEMMALHGDLFPKVAKWKADTRMRAHLDGRLVNPFAYVRHFFEVFRRNKSGAWGLGKEANEALAFLPQSTGAGMLREVLLALYPMEETLGFHLLVPIHDSILLECRPERAPEVVEFVRAAMERPWEEMGGLVVKIDCKWGPDWASLKTWKGVAS